MTNKQNEKEYTVNSISYRELKELKEEYEREEAGRGLEPQSIFRGTGIGASIGLAACLLLTFSGSVLTTAEAVCLMGGLAILGALAAYVTS